MTTSTMTVTHQSITINNTGDVNVNAIVENDGTYIRAIRILAEPVGDADPVEIFELVLKSPTKANIEFDAPGHGF